MTGEVGSTTGFATSALGSASTFSTRTPLALGSSTAASTDGVTAAAGAGALYIPPPIVGPAVGVVRLVALDLSCQAGMPGVRGVNVARGGEATGASAVDVGAA